MELRIYKDAVELDDVVIGQEQVVDLLGMFSWQRSRNDLHERGVKATETFNTVVFPEKKTILLWEKETPPQVRIIGVENPLTSFFDKVVKPLCDVRLTYASQLNLFFKGLIGALTHLEKHRADTRFENVFFERRLNQNVEEHVDQIFTLSGLWNYNELIETASKFDLGEQYTKIELTPLLKCMHWSIGFPEEFKALLLEHYNDPWYKLFYGITAILDGISLPNARIIAFIGFWIWLHTPFSATKARQFGLNFLDGFKPSETPKNLQELQLKCFLLQTGLAKLLKKHKTSPPLV